MTDFKTEDLEGTFLGVVVDNKDPLYLGRCKIKIFSKFDDIEPANLPWAFPVRSTIFAKTAENADGGGGGFGSFSFPKLNTLVTVQFAGGDLYSPQYKEVEIMNPEMQTLIKDDYTNSQVLLMDVDEQVRIFYTQKQGLLLFHKESIINIDKDTHVKIYHSGKTSYIEMVDGKVLEHADDKWSIDCDDINLGAETCTEPLAKCGPLMDMIGNLAKMLDAKLPVTGVAAQTIVNASKSGICSNIVKVKS